MAFLAVQHDSSLTMFLRLAACCWIGLVGIRVSAASGSNLKFFTFYFRYYGNSQRIMHLANFSLFCNILWWSDNSSGVGSLISRCHLLLHPVTDGNMSTVSYYEWLDRHPDIWGLSSSASSLFYPNSFSQIFEDPTRFHLTPPPQEFYVF